MKWIVFPTIILSFGLGLNNNFEPNTDCNNRHCVSYSNCISPFQCATGFSCVSTYECEASFTCGVLNQGGCLPVYTCNINNCLTEHVCSTHDCDGTFICKSNCCDDFIGDCAQTTSPIQ